MTRRFKYYRWILFAAVMVAVGWFIYRNVGEIRSYRFNYNIWLIVGAFFVEILAYLAQFVIWIDLSRKYDLKAPSIDAGRGFFVSQLGKYVPGKVGLVLVRMESYRGYSKRKIAVATGLEMILTIAAACIVVLFGIMSAGELFPSYVIYGSVVILGLILVLIYPPIFLKIINRFFKIIKREPIQDSPSYFITLKYVLGFILVALLHGMGFYLVLNSLSPVSFSYFLTITAVYYSAGIIGLITIFAPAGIGVREGILMLILPLIISEPVVIVGALLIRLLMTASELTLAGTFSLLDRLHKNTTEL